MTAGGGVDVLAVMDSYSRVFQPNEGRDGVDMAAARELIAELIAAAKRADVLVRLLTVRQVIEAGDEAIDAAGLNPYCMNEGLAEGHERIGFWHLSSALAALEQQS